MSDPHPPTAAIAHDHVFLSASLPDEFRGSPRAQHLFDFLVALIYGILSKGSGIVFGGHPTITPLVHRICVAHGFTGRRIALFQHRRFQSQAPPQVADKRVFDITWVGDENATEEAFADQLHEMRRQMAGRATAAVFIGGRTSGGLGTGPGIVEEYRLCCGNPTGPAPRGSMVGCLVGLLDGQVEQLIRDHESNNQREPNGLSPEELELLHYSDDPDLVAGIILADLLHSHGDLDPSLAERIEGDGENGSQYRAVQTGDGGRDECRPRRSHLPSQGSGVKRKRGMA